MALVVISSELLSTCEEHRQDNKQGTTTVGQEHVTKEQAK